MPTPAQRRPADSASIPSLDGIRGVAVSLVFFAHSGLENLVPGGLGVTIFFVLSGYLITSLIGVEYQRLGTIRLRDFYLRRLLRLMPPLFLVVAGACVLSNLSLIPGGFTAGGLLSALFYCGNYFDIAQNFDGMPAGIGVVWSLAVEEHFYLLYPLLMIGLLGLGGPRLAIMTLPPICALILLWRCWLASHGISEAYLSMATDTRIDAILVGCTMGLLRNPWLTPARQRGAADWLLTAVCLAALMLSLAIREPVFRLTFRYTVQSLAIAPLIHLAVVRADHPVYRWLNTRPLILLGKLSYSVYLSHQVMFYLVTASWPQLSWLSSTLLASVATLLVAAALLHWVERPCAVLRRRLHRNWRGRASSPPGNATVTAP